MELVLGSLKIEDQVTLSLRRLFEQYGYQKFRMGRFEEYELYAENKNFLKSEQIITFTDLSGRLLALKPDVTLSIVKNTKADGQRSEKLYYIENVYRLSRQDGEYKEISQMGLEFLGDVNPYATTEVLTLAIESLAAIDRHFVLEVSHMGFVGGLLDSLGVDEETRLTLMGYIQTKNMPAFKHTAAQKSENPNAAQWAKAFANLRGDYTAMLSQARKIASTPGMLSACDELAALYETLRHHPSHSHIQLDFSVANDVDYYNGITFQGYVEKAPTSVLSGGRYDGLVEKFHPGVGAIGFALYLDTLGSYYKTPTAYDVDLLLLYADTDDYGCVAQAVAGFVGENKKVRAERAIPSGLRYKTLYKMDGKCPKEVPSDA